MPETPQLSAPPASRAGVTVCEAPHLPLGVEFKVHRVYSLWVLGFEGAGFQGSVFTTLLVRAQSCGAQDLQLNSRNLDTRNK